MVCNENSTLFFETELVLESTTVKMKSDKYYFNSTKVVNNYKNNSTFVSPFDICLRAKSRYK